MARSSATFPLAGVTYFFRAPQESSENHLANISTRGFVNTGQGQLIGGFIVTGGPKLVLIRALGPSLASQGVTPALQNPVLKLMSGATELRSNDDWQSESNSDDIIATTIPPSTRAKRAFSCGSSRVPTRRSSREQMTRRALP